MTSKSDLHLSSTSGVAHVGIIAVVLSILIAVAYVLNLGGVTDATQNLLSGLLGGGLEVGELSYPVVEGGVAVDASITVPFASPVDAMTATSSTVQLLDVNAEPVAAQVRVDARRTSLQIDPEGTLRYGTEYTVMIAPEVTGADGEGVVQDEQPGASFTLRTQPVPANYPRPQLVRQVDGFDPERVRAQDAIPLVFSYPVDSASVNAVSIRLFDELRNPVPTEVTCCADNRAIITPLATLTPRAVYAVIVDSSVVDPAGVAMRPDSLIFQVAAAAAPRPTGPGRLSIDVAPTTTREHVVVVLDGDTLGAPPIARREITQNQNHTIEVIGVHRRSPHKISVFSRTLRPTPGQVISLSAEIEAFGWITIDADRPGMVFIDGQQVGRTLLAGYPVSAGTMHNIEVRPLPAEAGQFNAWTTQFQVGSLETTAFGRVTLPAKRDR